MFRHPQNTLLAVVISVMTVGAVWIAFDISASTLLSGAHKPPGWTETFLIPAVIVAILITFLWLSFIRYRIEQPLKRLSMYTEKLLDLGNTAERQQSLRSDDLPELSRIIEKLSVKMEDDLASFRKMEMVRSEFLGNVSHELRTPIFTLQGFIETLLNGAIDDPEVNRKFLERAYHQTTRLNNLLSDLIEISRIESGEMKLTLRYFDLDEFLKQTIAEMQPVAAQREIELTYSFDHTGGEPMVLGDKKRLKQVFDNLVENAIKYNVERGSVAIALALRKRTAEVAVIDNGIGIPEEHRSRIFERFYRVDKDRSRAIGGTGLGLAIVKHIVIAHRGTVDVSETPGGGSTFTVTLHK